MVMNIPTGKEIGKWHWCLDSVLGEKIVCVDVEL